MKAPPATLPWASILTVALLLAAQTVSASGPLRGLDDNGKLSGPFVSLDTHASLLSDMAERSVLAGTFGYGLRGGFRWCNIGILLLVEHNMWVATEYDAKVVAGAVNLGVGADYIYGNGLVRSALVVGPSILAWDTLLDDAGTVGLFLDIRPVGLRWPVHDFLVVGLDPLNLSVVAPVLGGIPLVNIQYRTYLYLEASF